MSRKLRILHTSDWHLGQKLANLSRDKEHEAALEWLVQTIVKEKVDVLVVSGDVFDTYNPSVQAETIYYKFIAKLVASPCRHIVITGGNHDSPAKLHAPKPLMDALQIHVIGQSSGHVADEVLVFSDEQNEPELIVAAVPFLREQNLALREVGQTIDARRLAIRTSIQSHFNDVAEYIRSLGISDVPVVCMAHLCVGGEEITEEQSRIYLGDSHTLRQEQFDRLFDYVALGHIHRPQKLEKSGRIRYSGSLIPLSFSEIMHKKVIVLADFIDGALHETKEISVPQTRKLVRIKCSLESLESELGKHASVDPAYPTWAEVVVESERPIPQLHQLLLSLTEQLSLEILKHSNPSQLGNLNQEVVLEQISQLNVIEVFERRCRQKGYPDEDIPELVADFKELQEWMESQARL
jgi:DNA repair protein SbcD/Mre11